MKKGFAFILFLVLMLPNLCYAGDKENKEIQPCGKFNKLELAADDLTYVYECVSIPSPESAKEYVPSGKITVLDEGKRIIYQELSPYAIDSCAAYPFLSTIRTSIPNYKLTSPKREWSLAVICGGISSTHQFLKIYMNDPIALNSTTLHFGDTPPNLADKNGDGLYEAVVFRRVLLDDVAYSADRYMTVYQLNIDDTMFGFIPLFGSGAEYLYLEYYKQLKKTKNSKANKEIVGVMLAALLATRDKDAICAEMKYFRNTGLSINELEKWKKKVSSMGYPDFDFAVCRGK